MSDTEPSLRACLRASEMLERLLFMLPTLTTQQANSLEDELRKFIAEEEQHQMDQVKSYRDGTDVLVKLQQAHIIALEATVEQLEAWINDEGGEG